ncbi:ABC transporter ATP-binding protein [Lacrimispora sp. NSJ-141]|uniref:ABC transporter ATP-binding protein n=1 Tax=Lientehia hominis TaxID=2897778 RepID=A0AAP2RL82_9FIRM|nr:ABC transporter ATP-binding protein [Lientehia hominis]MCD2492893.1 ABC transporter ATP-binding protein [Lientehia hominis]
MPDTIIALNTVSKIYDKKTVLKDVTFSVQRGQSIAFTGHNGSGKSTLLKLIARLVTPSGGTLISKSGLLFHYIPEHFPKSSLTARQYLRHMGSIDGLNKDILKEQEDKLSEDFFIHGMLDVPMKHLSKGTLQKVGVIQALLKKPDVLLLDEPLSGQDIESQAVFIRKVKELHSEGVTLLMSCHEPHLTTRISDLVFEIEGGIVRTADKEPSILQKNYILLFDGAPQAQVPPGISPYTVMDRTDQKGRLKISASEQESDRLLPLMLEKGWKLREMYEDHI